MKGLLLKDFLNLKRQAYLYAILLALFVGVSILSHDLSFVLFVGTIFSAMTVMSAMYYDEKSSWDKFALTTTVTRGELVLSKYLLGWLVLGLTAAVEVLVLFAARLATAENFLSLGAMACMGLLLIALIIPMILRFGVEKGRIFLIICAAAFVGVGLLVQKLFTSLPAFDTVALSVLVPVAVLLITLGSVFVSLAIYRKKEF